MSFLKSYAVEVHRASPLLCSAFQLGEREAEVIVEFWRSTFGRRLTPSWKSAHKPSTRDTAHTRWISFRLPHGVVEMLDEHVVREGERTGYKLTRTQALVKIIRDACTPE